MRRLLALADAAAILTASGALLGIATLTGQDVAAGGAALLVPAGLALWIVIAVPAGMYHVDERRIDCSIADELPRVFQLAAVWTWGVYLLDTLVARGSAKVAPAVALWCLSVPLILVARATVRVVARRRPWYVQTALVIGVDGDAERVATLLRRHPEYGIDASRTAKLAPEAADRRAESLIGLAETFDADRVIFASAYEGLDERTGALRKLAEHGIKVDLVPGDAEVFRTDAELHFVEGLPFLTLPSTGRPRSAQLIKRAIDVSLAAAGLVALAPVFAYVAVRIKLDSRGRVFFRQRRVGRDGRPFELFKFRTMYADADARKHEVAALNERSDGMFKIVEDPRITRFGAKLRRYSLDELPQLINVVRGEMSLVGPRPLIKEESDQVADHYQARFKSRPGITGPWQALGRSDIPFHDMLKLDYTYVVNWTVGEDLKLLLRTMGAIVNGRGAY